jgi:hypothetical protein
MHIRRALAIYKDIDIVAVVSSIAIGCLVLIITRLINGPNEWDWIGSVVGASICATRLAKQRERLRRNTDNRLGGHEPNGGS